MGILLTSACHIFILFTEDTFLKVLSAIFPSLLLITFIEECHWNCITTLFLMCLVFDPCNFMDYKNF